MNIFEHHIEIYSPIGSQDDVLTPRVDASAAGILPAGILQANLSYASLPAGFLQESFRQISGTLAFLQDPRNPAGKSHLRQLA